MIDTSTPQTVRDSLRDAVANLNPWPDMWPQPPSWAVGEAEDLLVFVDNPTHEEVCLVAYQLMADDDE